ncbi:MAG: alpha/beta hydrolase family esterase [Verrucomicrobiales bacterium]
MLGRPSFVALFFAFALPALAVDYDFGDAPVGYPVTLAEDGARHGSGAVLRLGGSRNVEANGVHFANALSPTEGDNGVEVSAPLQKETVATLTITVNNPCRLDAWVDWTGNGQWSGALGDTADQIAVAHPLVAGDNTLSVFVPGFAETGVTFARFRVSLAGRLPPTGEAPEGEVEDYRFAILESPTPFGATASIASNNEGRRVVRWTGTAAYSAQVEHSLDLLKWMQIDLPLPEVAGTNEVTIPLWLLNAPKRFFRVVRRPLTTLSIPVTPGFYEGRSFVHGGISRNYLIKIPSGWNAAQQWPLALILPGHGQSLEAFSTIQQEIFGMADARGWVIVMAEATSGPNSHEWFCYDNPNTATAPSFDVQPYLDDTGFLLALVSTVKASGLNINPARVYAAGFSNGGAMCHYLAAQPGHPFAAFAMLEGGTAPFAFYTSPYDRDIAPAAPNIPASVPMPIAGRPVMMMNMVTSIPWRFEGAELSATHFFNGAPNNVARWTEANKYGWVPQDAPVTPLPPPATTKIKTPWTATGNNRAPVAYDAMRPDAGWPDALESQTGLGWTPELANKFPYGEPFIAASLRAEYAHTISPESSTSARIRVDAGTMTTEWWRSAPEVTTNEVVFYALGDGGHQWPTTSDKLPFNGNVKVLDFFEAH